MIPRIAQVGVGQWGANHLRVFSQLDCQIVSVADMQGNKRKLAEQYNASFFTDYKKAIELADAISIAAPTNLHYAIARRAIQNGKHVFVEKPLTLQFNQARKLVELAKRKNVVLMSGHLFRFNNALLKLKQVIPKIGKIDYVTARYVHSSKPPRKDSGVIFNFASHLIDSLYFLFEEAPLKVYCSKINRISKEREDFASITLDYKNFVANMEVGWLHPLKKRDLWVIADKEKIYADLLEQELTSYPIEITQNSVRHKKIKKINCQKNEPLLDELKFFVGLVKNQRRYIDYSALQTIKICEKCLKSGKTGKVLSI